MGGTFRGSFCRGGRIGGDVGAGLARRRFWVCGGVRVEVAVAAGRAVPQVAGRVGAGGVALVDEVVAGLAGSGGLAAGLPESAPRVAAAAGGGGRTRPKEAPPEHGEAPAPPPRKPKRKRGGGGPGRLTPTPRDRGGAPIPAAAVAETPRHADDHRGD